jgi:CopA family copper-resistance protein
MDHQKNESNSSANSSSLRRGANRREFIQRAALATAGATLTADHACAAEGIAPHTPAILSGDHFELTIDSTPVNITGRRVMATTINGSIPGPTLRWREGDTVTVAVTNKLKVPTSIHWHGMRIPSNMDGVPGLSFAGIPAGETFVYRFPVKQRGTYWYHSHTRFQEQTGLFGSLIIEPREQEPFEYDREYAILFADWSDSNPETVFRNLKQDSDYYNYYRPTLTRFFSDVNEQGLHQALAQRIMWGRMNMTTGDIADVSGSTYTYLLNGNAPAANWLGVFEKGEKIRLRFVNGSSMTIFDVRIPGLPMTVVEADGNHVVPVTVDEFRMGVAESYDVIVQPDGDSAYTIFAQSLDRSGYARGTLAPRLGMTAAIPAMDPRPVRTMMEMGMKMDSMKGMDMSGVGGMKMGSMQGMDVSGMDGAKPGDMKGMDMSGMDMKNMPTKASPPRSPDQPFGMAGMETAPAASVIGKPGITPFPQPGPANRPFNPMTEEMSTPPPVKVLAPGHLHVGPQVVEVAAMTTAQLNNPGNGLADNGRRVLTYADLRSLYPGADARPPSREIVLHLTGNMERFIWGFDGYKYSAAEPINLKLGERVRITLINDTMMEHPIHLHGLWSELENGHGAFNPYKHTILVKPAEQVSYLLSADTPGEWAYHCHLLYHMKAGMFRKVVVS